LILQYLSIFHQFPAYYSYYEYRGLAGCAYYIIFGVALLIWSFFKAFQMTMEEKILKEKIEKRENNPNYYDINSSWGKVKMKSKRRRRRRHPHSDSDEYYQAPF